MTVGTEAQQDQIQLRHAVPGLNARERAQRALVGTRSGLDVLVFPPHPEHLRGGNLQRREKRLLRHSIVGFGVVRWHAALVTPEDSYARPVERPGTERGKPP